MADDAPQYLLKQAQEHPKVAIRESRKASGRNGPGRSTWTKCAPGPGPGSDRFGKATNWPF